MRQRFLKIFVDEESGSDALTKRVLERLKDVPFEFVRSYRPVKEYVHVNGADPIALGKRILYLRRNHGEKIKSCPCSKGVVSCGYHIINLQTGCTSDCSYCILQGYLNSPFITIYTNLDEYLKETEDFIANKKRRNLRVGTGELTDSLALDDITASSVDLMDLFGRYPDSFLEFKTKSSNIANLLSYPRPKKNIVIAWSLNPQKIIDSEELNSASLEERIAAAKACQDKGYSLAFHFDPLIIFEGWQEEYGRLIERLFEKIKTENVVWISLGALRFEPGLKPIIMERFRKSRIITEEFELNRDNKLKYLSGQKGELFRFVAEKIRKRSDEVNIYLCMEDRGLSDRIALRINECMGRWKAQHPVR